MGKRKTITEEQLIEVVRLSKFLGLQVVAKRLGLPEGAVRRAMIHYQWRNKIKLPKIKRNQWS